MWNLEKEELWFLIKCYNDYVQEFIDDRNLEDSTPVCLGEFYNNEYQEYYQYYLDLLWEELEDVPVNEFGTKIDEDFYVFKKGTDKEKIWRWFDERVERWDW